MINYRIDKLEKYCNNITGVRIALEKNQEHQKTGRPFRVRIAIAIPHKKEVIVAKEPGNGEMHTDILAEINEAFNTAERVIKKRKQ